MRVFDLFLFCFLGFLTQSFSIYPWLSYNSLVDKAGLKFRGLPACLLSAGIKDVYHHHLAKILVDFIIIIINYKVTQSNWDFRCCFTYLCCFLDKVFLCSPDYPGSCSVDQDVLTFRDLPDSGIKCMC